jgi:peptidoglycan-N-acetylglucosamine deacetylase
MVKLPGLPRQWRLLALTLVLLGGLLLLFFHFDEPLRRCSGGVKPEVRLQGKSVGRMFRSEVAAVVDEIARTEGRKPVDAVLDVTHDAIIPELNGVAVDEAATVERVMEAARGSEVAPVYRDILPSVRWDHYPSLPAYQGNPRKAAVALMINVAWGEEHLPRMLEALEKNEARGTFFLTGMWAEKNADMICRIAGGGHELGNHGYSDAEVFPELDSWGMAGSIRQTNEIIFDAAGSYPVYFTPHKGEFNDLTLEIVSRQRMRTVLWSLDTVDWQKPGVERMCQKILDHTAPGWIILMHPTADTATLLEEVLPLLRERGLQVVTMDELLNPAWFPDAVAGLR